jgi:CubicO group peptidase (beta-lactamase class C family)
LQLVERGALALDTPVVEILPYFRLDDQRAPSITIRQMLSHVSGMPDVRGYDWEKPEYDEGALERYVRSLSGEKLTAGPGERFAYSNMAYEVLGDVIAKASGQPFEEYVEAAILSPLQMPTSTFLKQKVDPALGASPHLRAPAAMLSPLYPYNRAHAPSSTLHSSVEEMCHWLIAHLQRGEYQGQRILSRASYELAWTPAYSLEPDDGQEFIGLAWFIRSHRGHRTIGHAGGDVGFNSNHLLLPDDNLGVVILANAVPSGITAITRAVLDILLGYEPQFPRPPAILPVYQEFCQKGQPAALATHQQMQNNQPEVYDFDPEHLADAVYLLAEIRRYPQALDLLNLGLALYPDYGDLYLLLATIYKDTGQRPQAILTLQEGLKRNPDQRFARQLSYELLGANS